MNKQTTAVQWLVNQFAKYYSIHQLDDQIEEAKEMEKQQQLSDEEIEIAAKEYVLYNDQKRHWVIEGMKLYREQLNNK